MSDPCRRKLLQLCANLRGAVLEILDKILQIADKILLIDDEIHRFHLHFHPRAIELPEKILVVLAQTLKVILQILPPGVDLPKGHFIQPFRPIQVLPNTAERTGGETGSLGGQIFQGDGQPLNLNGRLGHHILKLPVLKLGDSAGLARILNRREVLPLDQLL